MLYLEVLIFNRPIYLLVKLFYSMGIIMLCLEFGYNGSACTCTKTMRKNRSVLHCRTPPEG